jgi:hypothetical protein
MSNRYIFIYLIKEFFLATIHNYFDYTNTGTEICQHKQLFINL